MIINELEENGFTCKVAYDGLMGKKMFESGIFNLIILDINLPHMNGFQLCAEIRSVDQKIPVIMLTVMGITEDKLSGFNSGADDYLVKPFEFQELLARIRALLKRIVINNQEENVLKYLDLELKPATFEVTRHNRRIELTKKEFELLEFLLRNKGKIVTRAEIAEKIWDIGFETGTNVIDVYINFLRRKIDKDFSPKLIHTQVGFGYILKA